jgi:hypothetical protein
LLAVYLRRYSSHQS